jgi:hypothetical protein
VLSLDTAQAAAVAAMVLSAANDLARAHAAWAALKHGAYYLTTEPKLPAGSARKLAKLAPSPIPVEQVHALPVDDV